MKKQDSFRERLKSNVETSNQKSYAWRKKVGIDKGLFQYYWQNGESSKTDRTGDCTPGS